MKGIRIIVTLALCLCMGSAVAQTKSTNDFKKATSKQAAAPALIIDQQSRSLNEQGAREMQAKEFAKAQMLFKQALSVDPKNITAVFNLAGAYVMNKQMNDAIDLLNQYVKDFPKDPGLYSRLGEAYFANKDLPNAEVNFKKCLEIYPEYPTAAAKLASIYGIQGKIAETEGMLLVAVKQDSKNGDLLANLAAIFLANNKAEQAINTAKRALQVKPSSNVYVTMGAAYERLKDFNNAIIAFQRAIDLGETKPEVKGKIDELKERIKAAKGKD